MDRKVAYLLLALISAILFFVAVFYNGWVCIGKGSTAGGILSERCTKSEDNRVTGGLLLTAGLFCSLAFFFFIAVVMKGFRWSEILATVFSAAGAILGMVGVFYYLNNRNLWSPFIATIAMSLVVSLTVMIIFDLFAASRNKI